jgi:hypothetical protein
MSNWILTKGLQNLRSQANTRWPTRDHASDGTIGDTTHQAEMSGHNPDDTKGSRAPWNSDSDSTPEVRAFDMDSDLREPGSTAQMVVDHLRSLPGLSSVIRYMIYNRKMYHERDGFKPTAYSGPSAHTEHIHFEGAWTQAADNNTTFDFKFGQVGVKDDMSAADAKQGFADALAAMATGTNTSVKDDDKWGGQVQANFRRVVNAAVDQSTLSSDVKAVAGAVAKLSTELQAIQGAVVALTAKLDALKSAASE